MTINLVTQGEEIQLDLILSTNKQLKLYRNDVTAGLSASQIKALTQSSFTEANFTGYSAKTLTGGSWTTTQGDPTTGVYAQQTFTRTSTGADQTIYGYYVVRSSDGALEWFEDFTGPVVTNTNGDAIILTPTYTLDDDQEATVEARGLTGSTFSSTSNSSTFSTTTTSDMVLNNFSGDATRNYRVHVTTSMALSGSGIYLVFFAVDGVDTARIGAINGTSGNTYDFLDATILWQPSTTDTFDLTIGVFEAGGTATLVFEGASDSPRKMWVEDCGPR